MKTTDTPMPNLVTVERMSESNEPPLPEHIANGGEELGLDAQLEWVPITPYESLEGVLVGSSTMKLGGSAYLFETHLEGDIKQVLLKKGGRIFERCMQHAMQGDHLYIRYLGQLEAKPGQHPARNWRVLRLAESGT